MKDYEEKRERKGVLVVEGEGTEVKWKRENMKLLEGYIKYLL